MKIKKEKYDYYYNHDGETVVTVCYILTEDGSVGRGASVLSKQDEYDEKIGRKLARTHAIRAIKGRQIDAFKRKEVIDRLIQCRCPFLKKGERNPALSWWERRFLFGAKNMPSYIGGGERGTAAGTKLRMELQKLYTLKSRSDWFDKNWTSRGKLRGLLS